MEHTRHYAPGHRTADDDDMSQTQEQSYVDGLALQRHPDGPPELPPVGPPSRVGRRRWPVVLGVVLLVLALAAAGTGLAVQRSQLAATRADLAAFRHAQAANLTKVHQSLATQAGQLSTLTQQLATAKTQLQSAEARLKTDEQKLNVTTQKLPPDLTELAGKVSPSVVLVTCVAGTAADTGTAFALNLPAAAGYGTTLITAAHVVSPCADATVNPVLTVTSGSQVWHAHIRGLDNGEDVAILDTVARLPVLKPATDTPVVGEFVMAVGNPLGVVNNVTSGNVSQVYDSYVLDTAPVSNGNSGGPVVDKDGNVLGIVQGAATPNSAEPVVENLNVSLRLSTLCLSLLRGSTTCSSLH